MQETYPWFSSPQSALYNSTNQESSYFYNNSQCDYNALNVPYGSSYSYPRMNNMRTCEDNSRFFVDQSPINCPPMVYKQEDIGPGNSSRQSSLEHCSNSYSSRRCVPPSSNFENTNHKLDIKPCINIKQSSESEADNFSSVFTKSLTSLYSQDTDGNFVEDKGFNELCDESSKQDSQRLENGGSTNGYTFPTGFESQSSRFDNESNVETDKNCARMYPTASDCDGYNIFKVKTEGYPRGSSYRCDGLSYDDSHLNKRESKMDRKRKHSVPEVQHNNNKYRDNNKTKGRDLFSASCAAEWTPNYIPPPASNSNLLNNAYQQPEPYSINETEFKIKPKEEFPRHDDIGQCDKPNRFKSPRGRPAKSAIPRTDKQEEKFSKKPPKKISPLSVYAKIQNDYIVEVKCRRYKKRTKIPGGDSSGCALSYSDSNCVFDNNFDAVSNIVRDMVDRVAISLERKNLADLSTLTASKARELVTKFCRDYAMDFKDFENVSDIISKDVICNRKEGVDRRRKRRRTSGNEKPSPVLNKEVKTDIRKCKLKKQEGGEVTVEKRVLRSLPSRQPRRITRRTSDKNSFFRTRYPKRKLRGKSKEGRQTKKLKILIDISKDNESENSQGPPQLKVATKKGAHENDASNSDSVSIESSRNSRLKKKSAIEQNSKKTRDAEVESVITVSDDEDDDDQGSPTRNSEEISSLTVPTSADENKNLSSNDTEKYNSALGEPPQLVRMTDEKDLRYSDNNKKGSDDDELFVDENGKSPEPPPLNDGSVPLHSEPDDSEGELVIDMEAKEAENEGPLEPPLSSQMKPDCLSESETILSESIKHMENLPDDDCIVISASKETKVPENNSPKRQDAISIEVADDDQQQNDPLNLRKEKKDNVDKEPKSVESDNAEKKTESPSKNKDDGDESILRTLLLDSGEAASNAGSSDGQEFSNLLPVTKISNLNFKSISPCSVDSIKAQLSPFRHSPSVYNEEISANMISDFIKIPKYQAFHENYQNISSPSETSDIERRIAMSSKSSSPMFTQPIGIGSDNNKETWMKDPQQLKEKIKKLKNEIVYLQLMAEQKEKEKTAIVCFKRYKEEILKRIYKAYAFTVQDHVRDWINSKKENSGEKGSEETRSFTDSAQKQPLQQTKDEKDRVPESTNNYLDEIHELRDSSSYNATAQSQLRSSSAYYPSPTQKQHEQPHTGLPKKSSHQYGEKLPAVEAMVAKATENYGVDMRNIREGLQRSPETPVQGTILQKVLSSKDASRNSSPDYFHSPSWSPDHHRSNKHTLMPKPYPDHYIPLDVYLSRTSHRNSGEDSHSTKSSDPYLSSSQTFPRVSYSQSTKDKSRVQPLISEPVRPKVNPNAFRTWSIQTGGRVNESRSDSTKTSVVPSSTRQSSSDNMIGNPVFAHPSATSSSSSSSKLPSNYSDKTPAPAHDYKSRRVEENVATNYSRKLNEDRHSLSYTPVLPSNNSTMPYGGHLVHSERSSTTASTSTASSAKNTNGTTSAPPLCMGCGLSDAKFLCSGCRKHWYCSAQCQSLRWPEHSRVCGGQLFTQTSGSYS